MCPWELPKAVLNAISQAASPLATPPGTPPETPPATPGAWFTPGFGLGWFGLVRFALVNYLANLNLYWRV